MADFDLHLAPPIPDDEYLVEYGGFATATMFAQKTPKLGLTFFIVDGIYEGYKLKRWYNVKQIKPEGGFTAKSRTCALLMEYCKCFPDKKLARLDRIPLSPWEEGRYRVEVHTPDKNYEGEETPEQLRQSVIKKILGREQ